MRNEIDYITFILGYDLLHNQLVNGDEPECDLAYDRCARIAEEFCNSNFNNSNRDLYTCLTEYLEYYESKYDKTLTDDILDMELVDNYHIEHGGIAFAGETVRDFLEETNSPFNITVRELNDRLNLCGIKRIIL